MFIETIALFAQHQIYMGQESGTKNAKTLFEPIQKINIC